MVQRIKFEKECGRGRDKKWFEDNCFVEHVLSNLFCRTFFVEQVLSNMYCIVEQVLSNMFCRTSFVEYVLSNKFCRICIVKHVLSNLFCRTCFVEAEKSWWEKKTLGLSIVLNKISPLLDLLFKMGRSKMFEIFWYFIHIYLLIRIYR